MGTYFRDGTMLELIRERCAGQSLPVLTRDGGQLVLWSIGTIDDQQSDKHDHRIICCDLLFEDGERVGHKPMDESVGPSYYSCPLSLLDACPDPELGRSTQWRETVRKTHRSNHNKRVGSMVAHVDPAADERVGALTPLGSAWLARHKPERAL